MNIKEVRKISFEDLRHVCIKENWCTNATNDEYYRILCMSEKELTVNVIYHIALAIYNVSDVEDFMAHANFDEKDMLEHIMYIIAESSFSVFWIQ